MEIWKDVIDYEGLYQVSNLGRVKSLERRVKHNMSDYIIVKDRILKGGLAKSGYANVILCKEGTKKTMYVHRIVSEAFLNFSSNYKMVVNHINHIRNDNRLDNLEIITQRENASQKHLKSSSKYVGVYWNKREGKWRASIYIDKKQKQKHLGYFINELDANNAYQKALSEL